jgi:hypothetical protein
VARFAPVQFWTQPYQRLTRNSAESSDFSILRLERKTAPNEIKVLRTVRETSRHGFVPFKINGLRKTVQGLSR